jgi:hypothetical protein
MPASESLWFVRFAASLTRKGGDGITDDFSLPAPQQIRREAEISGDLAVGCPLFVTSFTAPRLNS